MKHIMKKIIPLLVVIAVFSIKCSSDRTKNIDNKIAAQLLHFPVSGEDTLKVSYFADTVIYIPLEMTSESVVGTIKHLWMNDSYILVHCREIPLLLFQRDGKFVRKIGKIGRGPGEYNGINNFCVILNTIYVSNPGKRSLLKYTFNGAFCGEIKFNYPPIYFTTTYDNKLVCYNNLDGKIAVYNKNLYSPPDTIIVEYGVTKGRYLWKLNHPTLNYLQKTPSGLLFYNYVSDTVWKINTDTKEPAYILDMKDRLIPYEKQLEFYTGRDLVEWGNMVKLYIRVHLIPFTSMMIIIQNNWLVGTDDAIYLNNMKTREIKRYNTNFFYDDIVSCQKLIVLFQAFSEDYLVTTVVGPERDKNKLKGNPSPLWLDLIQNVKETDNPIISLIRIKKELFVNEILK